MSKRARQPHSPADDVSEAERVRRLLEFTLAQARAEADLYDRELSDQPFWRFLRRRATGKQLAEARERERRALGMLDRSLERDTR